MYELTVESHFDAAHHIEDYPGHCARLHGHTWRVEVVIRGERLNELGMLVDFGILKEEVGRWMDRLDHRYLNELDVLEGRNPTAEWLAEMLFKGLRRSLDSLQPGIRIHKVIVWESPQASAAYFETEDNR